MTELKLRPYHVGQRTAPMTSLTALTAGEIYLKMQPFLAIQRNADAPGLYNEVRYSRDLFKPNGFHFPVRWQAKMKEGWMRLTYEEFLVWYGIPT